jgi:hypothetical protein
VAGGRGSSRRLSQLPSTAPPDLRTSVAELGYNGQAHTSAVCGGSSMSDSVYRVAVIGPKYTQAVGQALRQQLTRPGSGRTGAAAGGMFAVQHSLLP